MDDNWLWGARPEEIVERAWAAGFFDGEGSATRSVRNWSKNGQPYAYLYLQVTQRDRRALDRFAAAVGVGNVTGPYEYRKGQPHYRWAVTGRRAECVADMLLPFLAPAKREQIEAVRGGESLELAEPT